MAEGESLNPDLEIGRKLAAMSVDADGVESRTMEHLRRIEAAISSECRDIERARATLRGKGLSVSAVAKASGVSRATFYNKPLLSDYVEYSRREVVGDDVETVGKEELDEMRRKVELLTARDGRLVLALADKERLEKRVEALESALRDAALHREGMPTGMLVSVDGSREESGR